MMHPVTDPAVRSDTDTVAQTAELTISWRGGGRNQFSRRITAHFGSHQVDLCAAAGVGADLCMLVEVQFTRVHDLPVKLKPMRGFYTPSRIDKLFTEHHVWWNSAILWRVCQLHLNHWESAMQLRFSTEPPANIFPAFHCYDQHQLFSKGKIKLFWARFLF